MNRLAPCLPAVLALLAAPPAPASQKPCRDAQGKVIKCPKPPRTASPRCKDATGKFVACKDSQGKPGAGS